MSPTIALLSEAGPAPAPHARAHAVPISAAGVSDVSALARQQLPNAVPAATLIAAYNASIQPQQKPVVRSNVAQPSSALAAQFIAQDAFGSEGDLAIFAPRSQNPDIATAPEEDYLRDLRIARGDIAAVSKTAPRIAREGATTAPATQAAPVAATLPQPAEQSLRTSFSQIAAGLPMLMWRAVKRPMLFNARGVSAYQLASMRNANLKPVEAT